MTEISLRITHPFFDPKSMTGILQQQPRRIWSAGHKRTNANGTPIEGVSKNSFWEYSTSASQPLDKAVKDFIDWVVANAAFLSGMAKSGGDIEVAVEDNGKPVANAIAAADLARLKEILVQPGLKPSTKRRF